MLCHRCDEIHDLLVRIAERQERTLDALGDLMSQQAQVDADVQALTSALSTLTADFQAEVAALQAALDADQPIDLTNLDSIASQFSALATSEAPPAPAPTINPAVAAAAAVAPAPEQGS